MEKYLLLDQKAKSLIQSHKRIEAELIDTLQELKKENGFSKLGFKSAFEYLTMELGLSRDQAYNFTRVAEKCSEVPELKKAIEAKALNVSTARRILTVVHEDSKTWIEKAIELPQQALEREVARVNPKALLPERTKIITADLVENRYLATNEEEEILQRVIDLESQRQRRHVTRQEAIKVMALLYLKTHDPVEKAERAKARQGRVNPKGESIKLKAEPDEKVVLRRTPIPAKTKHELNLRDKGKCVDCGQSRWTERHHLKLVSKGGTNDLTNLITVCTFHHKKRHEPKEKSATRPMQNHQPSLADS